MNIYIMGRHEAERRLFLGDITPLPQVVSIHNRHSYPPMSKRWKCDKVLQLSFNDNLTEPKPRHVLRIIEFGRGITVNDHLVCHCEAGISRSSAAAIIIASLMFPAETIISLLSQYTGWIDPNEAMICLADEELKMNGELIKIRNYFTEKAMENY